MFWQSVPSADASSADDEPMEQEEEQPAESLMDTNDELPAAAAAAAAADPQPSSSSTAVVAFMVCVLTALFEQFISQPSFSNSDWQIANIIIWKISGPLHLDTKLIKNSKKQHRKERPPHLFWVESRDLDCKLNSLSDFVAGKGGEKKKVARPNAADASELHGLGQAEADGANAEAHAQWEHQQPKFCCAAQDEVPVTPNIPDAQGAAQRLLRLRLRLRIDSVWAAAHNSRWWGIGSGHQQVGSAPASHLQATRPSRVQSTEVGSAQSPTTNGSRNWRRRLKQPGMEKYPNLFFL